MSIKIQCNGCKRLFEDDSTSKGELHVLWVDQRQHFHLCSVCYDGMMREIMHLRYSPDEAQYVPAVDEASPKIKEVAQKKWDGGWTGYCPHCGEAVERYRNRFYCGTCGHALKWE